MDQSPIRINFDLSKNEMHSYSKKEHFQISSIAKFSSTMCKNTENVALRSQIVYLQLIPLTLFFQKRKL